MQRGTVAALAVALALAAALAMVGCGSAPFHGIEVEPPTPAPALRLPDGSGGRFDLGAERGHVTLVFFGYASCPDICPTTLTTWAEARRLLGEKAGRARFVFVSIDPERDTPVLVRAFVRRFDPTFIGLTGRREELEPILRAWRQAPRRDASASGGVPTITHSPQSYLVDREGRLRVLYPRHVTARALADDLARLL